MKIRILGLGTCASNYSTLSSRAVVRPSRKHGFAGSKGKKQNMSNNPTDHVSGQPDTSGGPVDRPDGSIDDDSVHPLTDPDDPTTGNIDPAAPLGNAPTGTDAEPAQGEDGRLMGPAGN
jgi:hypothetical protein